MNNKTSFLVAFFLTIAIFLTGCSDSGSTQRPMSDNELINLYNQWAYEQQQAEAEFEFIWPESISGGVGSE